ncbi:MAG: hypothetical protein JWL61_2195 [Gemmatimonadetes bacterium]|jgi:hypothetical protein|nr:hypothetical protein [Gemmatimonadota bacterium]
MADDKKTPTQAPLDDKTEKVTDLPTKDASGKDDQVKGGGVRIKAR